jgi:hypothetical protein
MNIIKLLKQAGFNDAEVEILASKMNRFAAIVQANALERAAAVADEYADDSWIGDRDWEAAKMIAEDIRNLKEMK